MTGSLVSSLLSRGGSGGGSWPMSKVIVKANSLPTAEIKYVGSMYIYAGETTAAYKHGYIYEGTSTPANTKTVSFSPNTISCTGENFWAFWKSEDGAPNNYTEIIKGEMVLGSETAWTLVGRNTNNEIVKSYQQNQSAWEALGFSFTGTFSEGDSVGFSCAINETDDIIYWWQRIDVQPAGTSSSTGIAVDDQLSFESQNPVQNKVITEALEETGYDTWKKPEDWVNIESGALPNSIYMLVGHSADYSVCPYFAFNIVLSATTHKYKVYIDNKLQGAYSSGENVKLSWEALALTSGFNTTFPESLRVHVVRFVPENDADTFASYSAVRYASSGNEQQGILWVHFTINSIGYFRTCYYAQAVCNRKLVAITAIGDKIHFTGTNLTWFLGNTQDRYPQRSEYLVKLPTIEVDTVVGAGGFLNHAGPLKTAKIIVNNSISFSGSLTGNGTSFCSGNLEKLDINKPIVLGEDISTALSLFRASSLKKLPSVDFSKATRLRLFVAENTKLQDTILNVSDAINLTQIRVPGSTTAFMGGLKGLIVSNAAPFNDGSSPQIDVSYTGLNRAALVDLFKSMPYNVGYTVVGSPTIENGVLSDTNYLNRLDISQPIPIDKDLEVQIHLTDFTFKNALFYLFRGGLSVYVQNNGNLTISYIKEETSAKYLSTVASDISSYTGYWKIIKSSNDWTLQYSSDGQTFNVVNSWENQEAATTSNETITNIGYSGAGAKFNLNNTYIKVNGKTWSAFDEISRTVSVVGCTGAANWDETEGADVRAIAENKGWEVTYR